MKRFVCGILLLVSLLALAGCGKGLSEQELARANEAFDSEVWDEEKGQLVVNELNGFFLSTYTSPEEIDLNRFLWYCPVGSTLSDDDNEEFQAVMDQNAYLGQWERPSDYPVPVRRYRKADVSAILQKYAGITVDDLNSWDHVIYLEAYDAFYNFTSDYAPGWFVCTGGEKAGDTVRLWSEEKVLTLREADGRYLIRSFQSK